MPADAAGNEPLAIPPCPGCGYDYGTTVEEARRVITDGASTASQLLQSSSPRVTERPGPQVWSPLEYAAHVRDLFTVQRDRVILALVADNPHFTPMYRDERAGLARYAEEAPTEVSATLVSAARLLDWLYQGLDPGQLARPCMYNLPGPTQVDVGFVLVHTAHEMHHHLDDMRRGLALSAS